MSNECIGVPTVAVTCMVVRHNSNLIEDDEQRSRAQTTHTRVKQPGVHSVQYIVVQHDRDAVVTIHW
jgi:hypothetical protein